MVVERWDVAQLDRGNDQRVAFTLKAFAGTLKMEALYVLIPLSVVIVYLAVWIFLVMAEGGQFDDTTGPALRILQDDDKTPVLSNPEHFDSSQ